MFDFGPTEATDEPPSKKWKTADDRVAEQLTEGVEEPPSLDGGEGTSSGRRRRKPVSDMPANGRHPGGEESSKQEPPGQLNVELSLNFKANLNCSQKCNPYWESKQIFCDLIPASGRNADIFTGGRPVRKRVT
ncbi:hypothetical protein R3P38DRAFT_2777068 [Favolaschia claudopus]|uniref:Uncharacterized protein n=1 Tax=Favolaschia claudopus TaxID=2862362 RepID=A0AAW0BH05_9AGAR